MDPVQSVVLILATLCLFALNIYARTHRRDLFIIAPAFLALAHVIVFYLCIWAFYPSANFSFTHWSRWLRLHEYGTLLIILMAMIAKHNRQHRLGHK